MPPCINHPLVEAQSPCARCTQPFCEACLVEFLGARYCGPCRDVRLQEVQGPGLQTAPFAGTGQVDIGRWLTAGWQIVQSDLQTFALASLLASAVGLLSCGVTVPALSCGIYLMAFRKMTAGYVTVENVFDGFRRFLWAFLVMLLMVVVIQIVSLVFAAPVFLVEFFARDNQMLRVSAQLLNQGLSMLLSLFVGGATFFVLPLVAARNVNPMDALTLSWAVFRRNPIMFCLAELLFQIIAMSGVLACCVGILVTAPLIAAAKAQAYADHFGIHPSELP